jgi:YD repeat-containing protein
VYEYPVNYRTAGGSYAPIDPKLVASRTGYRQAANDLGVVFPSSARAALRTRDAGGGLALSLVGADGRAVVSGVTDRVVGALPGVDVTYRSLDVGAGWSAGMSSLAASRGLRWLVRASSGLSVDLASGGVQLRDRAGRVVWVVGAPTATTGAGLPLAVRVSLHRTAAGTVIRERVVGVAHASRLVAHAWRLSPLTAQRTGDASSVVTDADVLGGGRVQPLTVTMSGTVFPGLLSGVSGITADCYIASAAPTTSYCSQAADYVGPNDHMLLNFNIAANVPDHSEILYAWVANKQTSESNSTSESVGIYQAAKPWTTSATWNTYDGTHAWTTAGGDTTGAVEDVKTFGSASDVGQYWYWSVDAATQNYVDGNPSTEGFLLEPTSGGRTNVEGFATVTSSTPPYMQIYYEPRAGNYPGSRYDSQQLSDRTSVGVNVASGDLLYQADDVHLPGVNGLDVNLTRSYNNLSSDQDSVGMGWSMGTGPDTYLVVPSDDDNQLDYFDGTGAAQLYETNSTGAWVAPPGSDAVVSMNAATASASTSFSFMFRHSGLTETFTSGTGFPKYARLTTLTDRNGNTITYHYNSSGQLTSLVDSHGATTTFAWTNGYITKVTDPIGRTYQYVQNSSGQLTSYTDPNNKTTSYGYDGYGNLTKITTAHGDIINIAYDAGHSERVTSITRLVHNTDSTGPTTSYSYSGAVSPCNTDPGWKELISTDPDGHNTTYCTDDLGRIASVTDANGNMESTGYEPDGYIKTLTDGLGTPQAFTYSTDGKDNVMSIQDGTGTGAMTQSYQYGDSTNNPYEATTATDAQGNNTTYAYGTGASGHYGAGEPTSITDQLPSQNQATLTYNANGTVATSTDADGNETFYGYTNGDLTSVMTPASSGLNPITLTYDSDNRVTKISSISGSAGHEVDYTYDPMDRITQAVYKNAAGTVTATLSYTYDSDGDLTSSTDAHGTTNYTYDGLDRLTGQSFPNGTSDTYGYDAASNLITLQDAGGTTTYGYDPANRLTSATDPGASTATTLSYDDDGNLLKVTYPSGASITRTYNAMSQITNVADTYITSGGPTYSDTYAYAYLGTLVHTVTDVAGNLTTYSYDALNRLTDAKITNGSTQVGDNAYVLDGNGNILQSTYNGTTTSNAYNSGNQTCWSYAWKHPRGGQNEGRGHLRRRLV